MVYDDDGRLAQESQSNDREREGERGGRAVGKEMKVERGRG